MTAREGEAMEYVTVPREPTKEMAVAGRMDRGSNPMTTSDDAMEEMRAALEPFAKVCDALMRNDSDFASTPDDEQLDGVADAENNCDVYITVGDLRRAAKALASAQEKVTSNCAVHVKRRLSPPLHRMKVRWGRSPHSLRG